jgi:hypothetical protein
VSVKAQDVYRILKMVGTAIVAGVGYFSANTHQLPEEWKVTIDACLVALIASGLYVTPSPIHQADIPVAVPPDVIALETEAKKTP